jgi:hypothetical protein
VFPLLARVVLEVHDDGREVVLNEINLFPIDFLEDVGHLVTVVVVTAGTVELWGLVGAGTGVRQGMGGG